MGYSSKISENNCVRKAGTIWSGTHFLVWIMEISDPEQLQSFVKPDTVAGMVESIIGCKWSLSVLHLVNQGINRPGAMERSIDGLTTKVLNERLRKLVNYGILQRYAYPEIPPRVEYKLTVFGEKFVHILNEIEKLNQELQHGLVEHSLEEN
jgi:DNA-binding HxlR family transcriptional regulator